MPGCQGIEGETPSIRYIPGIHVRHQVSRHIDISIYHRYMIYRYIEKRGTTSNTTTRTSTLLLVGGYYAKNSQLQRSIWRRHAADGRTAFLRLTPDSECTGVGYIPELYVQQ